MRDWRRLRKRAMPPSSMHDLLIPSNTRCPLHVSWPGAWGSCGLLLRWHHDSLQKDIHGQMQREIDHTNNSQDWTCVLIRNHPSYVIWCNSVDGWNIQSNSWESWLTKCNLQASWSIKTHDKKKYDPQKNGLQAFLNLFCSSESHRHFQVWPCTTQYTEWHPRGGQVFGGLWFCPKMRRIVKSWKLKTYDEVIVEAWRLSGWLMINEQPHAVTRVATTLL